MAAHRTWGVFYFRSASYSAASEVAFLSAAGADLSTGGTAGASSAYIGYPASHAFDKNNATEWYTADGDAAPAIWYVHPAPVAPAKLRLRFAAGGYVPASTADVRVRYSDDMGATWSQAAQRLVLESGSFAAGAAAVLLLQPPLVLTPLQRTQRLQQNFLQAQTPSTGVITDRVMFKATPTAPESTFALGRVWLLRLADGYKAWEGWSDAGGYYTATGLELGVEYIAVGIDPYRNHKATGAGPVVATEAAP